MRVRGYRVNECDNRYIAYHVNGDNLAAGLLCLVELAKEVPETGLGHDLIRREDTHAEELGRWVLGSWELAPNDLILLESWGHF